MSLLPLRLFVSSYVCSYCCRILYLFIFYFHRLFSIFLFFFFFSSRRRHTRLVSDWSSDVCSSDLAPAAAPVSAVKSVTPGQISPPPPGDARYRNRRLLALFFDMMTTPPPDQLRGFRAADKFIRAQMQTPDLIAIMTFQKGVVSVLQDFTDDRTALLETLAKLMYPDEDDSNDPIGAFGQDSGEFNLFNTDRQLAALHTAVSMLRSLPEQKSLVYFASGVRLTGGDNQAQLRATINAAVRANVSFFPVDARGLVASAPLGDAGRPSPGGIGVFSGTTAMALVTGFQRSQDTLYALAADTGGK